MPIQVQLQYLEPLTLEVFLHVSYFFLKKKKKIIYLAVLGLSCGTWGLRSLLRHVGSSSLTRD